ERDPDGVRLRKDGRGRLQLTCETFLSNFDYAGVADMIRDQWRVIGVDLQVQIVHDSLFIQRSLAGAVQMTLKNTAGEDPLTFPAMLFPSSMDATHAMSGPEYVRWFQSDGETGKQPPAELVAVMTLWRRAREVGEAERIQIGREILRRLADQVINIGIIAGG